MDLTTFYLCWWFKRKRRLGDCILSFWRSFAKDSNIQRGWLILLIFCHYVDVLRGFLNSLNLCLILPIFCHYVEILKGFSNILSRWLIHFYPGLDGHAAASTLPGWLPGKTGAEVMVGRANSICPHRPPFSASFSSFPCPLPLPHPHSEALHWWHFLEDMHRTYCHSKGRNNTRHGVTLLLRDGAYRRSGCLLV